MKKQEVPDYKVYKKDGKDITFKYNWVYLPYQAGDNAFRLAIDIVNASQEMFGAGNARTIPELSELVQEIIKKYGCIEETSANLVCLFFAFSEYDMLLECITTVSQAMARYGVAADTQISRLTGMPSYEYGNEVMQYIFNAPVTMRDLENHMKYSAKLDIDEYTEMIFGSCPLTSDVKFDPSKSLGNNYLFNQLEVLVVGNEKLQKLGETLKNIGKGLDFCRTTSYVETQSVKEDTVISERFWC